MQHSPFPRNRRPKRLLILIFAFPYFLSLVKPHPPHSLSRKTSIVFFLNSSKPYVFKPSSLPHQWREPVAEKHPLNAAYLSLLVNLQAKREQAWHRHCPPHHCLNRKKNSHRVRLLCLPSLFPYHFWVLEKLKTCNQWGWV